jgi:hypothetical protein
VECAVYVDHEVDIKIRIAMVVRLSLVLVVLSLHAAASTGSYLKRPAAWFASPEGRTTTACILSWQSDQGSWPKNQDTTQTTFNGDRAKIRGTFDNSATTDELWFLARAFRATEEKRCLTALKKGALSEIGAERRNGYTWYGNWGLAVAKDHARWPHR